LNGIVTEGNVLDAERTRSQPCLQLNEAEIFGLVWRKRGIILRPDTEVPALYPSVQSNTAFIQSLGCSYFIAFIYEI